MVETGQCTIECKRDGVVNCRYSFDGTPPLTSSYAENRWSSTLLL